MLWKSSDIYGTVMGAALLTASKYRIDGISLLFTCIIMSSCIQVVGTLFGKIVVKHAQKVGTKPLWFHLHILLVGGHTGFPPGP